MKNAFSALVRESLASFFKLHGTFLKALLLYTLIYRLFTWGQSRLQLFRPRTIMILFTGLAYDLVAMEILLGFLVLLWLLAHRIRIVVVVSLLVQLLYILINSSNYGASKFFVDGIVVPSLILEYLKDARSLFLTGSGVLTYPEIGFLFLIPIISIIVEHYCIWKMKKPIFQSSVHHVRVWIPIFLFVALLWMGADALRVGFEDHRSLLQTNTFIRFYDLHRFSKTKQQSVGHFSSTIKTEDIKNFRAVFQHRYFNDDTYPITYTSETLPSKVNQSFFEQNKISSPNIIIILLESVNAKDTGMLNFLEEELNQSSYGGGIGHDVTPFLSALMKKSIVFPRFYANGEHTASGQTAVLCSVYETLDYSTGTGFIMRNYPDTHLKCLPSILKMSGYDTYFFTSYNIGFDNENVFLPQIGFAHIYGSDELQKKGEKLLTWGLPDQVTFERGLTVLHKVKTPFMATFLTTTPHAPFQIPAGSEELGLEKDTHNYKKYLDSVHYLDTSLREYFSWAEKEPWYQNTLFVLTSDHGAGYWPAERQLPNRMAHIILSHRIPFLLYHPQFPSDIRKIVTHLGSQVDIAPTILHLLGRKEKDLHFVGQDLLQEGIQERHVFLYQFFDNFVWINNENKAFMASENKMYALSSLKDITVSDQMESAHLKLRTKSFIDLFNGLIFQNRFYPKQPDATYRH